MLTPAIPLSFTLLLSLPFMFFFAPQMLTSTTSLYLLDHNELNTLALFKNGIHLDKLPYESDELDDPALFNEAIEVSARTTSAPSTKNLDNQNPKPKIAFLFMINSDLSFSPLWEKFFHGKEHFFNIYIHSDPSVVVKPPGGVFNGKFIKSQKTERSSPSLISAARRLLANALIDDPQNQYFAVVSQYCIPLHSFDFIYNFLFQNQFNELSEFMEPSEMESRSEFEFKSFIEILDDQPSLWDRYKARGEEFMLPEITFNDFRIGSQFYILTRKHAVVVVEDTMLWNKFKVPCLDVWTCYPEESYFSTLLNMEDPDSCTGFTLTRVNWTACHDGHPHTYAPKEVSPKLIHELRQSELGFSYLFARKFTAKSLPRLMEIADDVIFRD